MSRNKGTHRGSRRQDFRANLEAFSNVVNLFGRSKLEGFQPRLRKQATCIVHYFSVPQPVALKYLDDALAELVSIPGFTAKAKNLTELRTNEGFAEFRSVLIELWFAAQFARHRLSITCEPKTAEGHRAEFKVEANGVDVYFEVRNLEPPGCVTVGVSSSNQPWPRRQLRKFEDIIRQAFYQLPYPYQVELRPYDLSVDERAFEADIQVAIGELQALLRDIHQSKETLPIQPLNLPRKRPRLTVLSIRKLAGLRYAWLGWVESSANRLQKLADSAQNKIREKGQQLAPDAANVLVVGLPIWAQNLAFAEELVGPLTESNRKALQTDSTAIKGLGQKVRERVSAFVFFQPADRIDLYPGRTVFVLNPLGRYPLPETVEAILTELCSSTAT